MQTDIAISIDKDTTVGLILLNLSAAFDTKDHFILFDCLQHRYGIDGFVLKVVNHTSIQRNRGLK